MKIPTIGQLGKSKIPVKFARAERRKLWYSATYVEDDGAERQFEFPIDVSWTDDGVFLPEHKPVQLMRWMREHLEFIQRSLSAAMGGGPPPYDPPDYSQSRPAGTASRGIARPYPPGVK